MNTRKQMQRLGLLNPTETPELKAAVTAIGNADTEQEIADILKMFKVSFLKTLANYESIYDIKGLRKSELVAKIASTKARFFRRIDRRNVITITPAEEVYLMRTQGITPAYVWDSDNWDKGNPDKTDPSKPVVTYKLPNNNTTDNNAKPESLYDDGSFSDAPGDNSCPDQDIPDEHYPDVSTVDNPCFTVEPSHEIERPNYTPYPDTIADERPYVYVQPCYTPTHHTAVNPITAATMRFASALAALLFVVYKVIIPVWYMRKQDLKKANANTFVFSVGYKYPALFHDKRQFITISDRRTDKYGFTWLSFSDEDNNSYNVKVNTRDDGYTELFDMKELERSCYAFEGLKPTKESNRVKYVKFEVGKSYTAVSKHPHA